MTDNAKVTQTVTEKENITIPITYTANYSSTQAATATTTVVQEQETTHLTPPRSPSVSLVMTSSLKTKVECTDCGSCVTM